MTPEVKIISISDAGYDSLTKGGGWEDWKASLQEENLATHEINTIKQVVVDRLNDYYGPVIHEQLLASGEAQAPELLDRVIFNQIVAYQIKEAKAVLSQNMLDDLERISVKEALVKHKHPLLDDLTRSRLTARYRKHGRHAGVEAETSSPSSFYLYGSITLFFGALGVGILNGFTFSIVVTVLTSAIVVVYYTAQR